MRKISLTAAVIVAMLSPSTAARADLIADCLRFNIDSTIRMTRIRNVCSSKINYAYCCTSGPNTAIGMVPCPLFRHHQFGAGVELTVSGCLGHQARMMACIDPKLPKPTNLYADGTTGFKC